MCRDQDRTSVLMRIQAGNPRFTRSAAAKYMMQHKDDFMPFLASIDGEDTAAAAAHEGLMTEQEFTKYCFNVAETGEWGGEPEVRETSLTPCSGEGPAHVANVRVPNRSRRCRERSTCLFTSFSAVHRPLCRTAAKMTDSEAA